MVDRVSQTRRYTSLPVGPSIEIYQYSTEIDIIRVVDLNGDAVDLSGKTIRFVARFFTGTFSADASELNYGELSEHPVLQLRELDYVDGSSDLSSGDVAVRRPADLWTEKIAYGEGESIPIVIVNVLQEEDLEGSNPFREIYRFFYTIRAADVTAGSYEPPSGQPDRGVRAGGTTGQLYAKKSDVNFDGEWVDPPTGTSTSGLTQNQVDARITALRPNEFTDADESKLDGIETNATADQTAAEIKTAYESNNNTNAFTDNEKTKLGNTPTTFAPVNAEQNVKSDWDATTGDAEILNKPSIPSTFSDLTGLINDANIPLTITRDTEVQDSVTGASVSDGHLNLTRRSGTNPLEVDLPIGFGLGQIGDVWNATAANNGNYQNTGIVLPDNPADNKIYLFAAAWGGYSPVFRPVTGRVIKSLSTGRAGTSSASGTEFSLEADGDSNLRAAKTSGGTLLLGNGEGAWEATDFFALYEITDQAPQVGDVASSVVGAVKYWLNDVASTSLGTSYTEDFVDINSSSTSFSIGGVTVNGDGRIVIPRAGLYHIETALHLVDPSPNNSGGRRTIFSRTRILRGGSIVTNTESLTTSYARGSNDATDVSIEHNDWELLQQGDVLIVDIKAESSARNYRVDGPTSYVSVVGFATAEPVVLPYISQFDLSGELTPTAGDIGGNSYNYDFAIAHADQASTVRIVGFAGTTPTGSVSVLATATNAQFAHSSGNFVLPGTINLAVDDVYTVRLEVYTSNSTVGSDSPTTYQDRRIVAHAPVAATRFFRVPYRINNARPTADNLVDNYTVISTAGSVIGQWIVTGIPDNSDSVWLVGFLVPQNATQPTHFILGGINNDIAFAPRFAVTDNGVNYWCYLNIDDARGDDLYNTAHFTVT